MRKELEQGVGPLKLPMMDVSASSNCPRCAAPRAPLPECPRCGVIYAKADARAARANKAHAPVPERAAETSVQIAEVLPESARWRGELEDAALELRLRQWALPVALAVAYLLLTTSVGHFLLRIFFGMWVHEVGHAAAAWLCGFPAFPGPWLTPVASQRSLFLALFLAAGLSY